VASAAGKAAARAAELEGRRDHGKTMGKTRGKIMKIVGKSWGNDGKYGDEWDIHGNLIGKVWRICQESDDMGDFADWES
jgi:hypothetical protein